MCEDRTQLIGRFRLTLGSFLIAILCAMLWSSYSASWTSRKRAAHVDEPLPGVLTAHLRRFQSRNIEDVRVGDRVVANTRDLDDSYCWPPEPDPNTWKHICLSFANQERNKVKVELLRPDDWLREHQIKVGTEVAIDLREFGCCGTATVDSVKPCPPIQSGAGCVVTGTYLSEKAEDVYDLAIEGLETTIGVTSTHPVYSVDRKSFVHAHSLRKGESVRLAKGEARKVTSLRPRHGSFAVYNLEVHGAHVYHVSALGVLVHNQRTVAKGPKTVTVYTVTSRPVDLNRPQGTFVTTNDITTPAALETHISNNVPPGSLPALNFYVTKIEVPQAVLKPDPHAPPSYNSFHLPPSTPGAQISGSWQVTYPMPPPNDIVPVLTPVQRP